MEKEQLMMTTASCSHRGLHLGTLARDYPFPQKYLSIDV
jgi:hypothetical protein